MAVIATAALSIPKAVANQFPREGSGLTRYVSVFRGVEISSTFYRRHKPSTLAPEVVSSKTHQPSEAGSFEKTR